MKTLTVLILPLLFLASANSGLAGEKEDILGAVNKNIEAFNKHDFVSYFSSFAQDNTEFPYVVSPLRHDAAAWRSFIEGTATLEYVNYHHQDELVQTYNGNTAVVTAYYLFTWKPKGEEMQTQSGRASMVLVKQGGKWFTVHMHFSKFF